MFFKIDPDCGLAIYDQLERQVKFAIATGALTPGELVPSLRELAKELALNPNTIARAYRDLQAEGILEMQRGMGLAVTPQALKKCQQERGRLLRERLRSVLLEGKQSDHSDDELRTMFEEELAALSSARGHRRRSNPP